MTTLEPPVLNGNAIVGFTYGGRWRRVDLWNVLFAAIPNGLCSTDQKEKKADFRKLAQNFKQRDRKKSETVTELASSPAARVLS